MQSESKQTRASLKLVFTLSLMMGLSQGCSNFNAGDLANSGQSASSARQLAIQSDRSAPAINQQILFNSMGVSFSIQLFMPGLTRSLIPQPAPFSPPASNYPGAL